MSAEQVVYLQKKVAVKDYLSQHFKEDGSPENGAQLREDCLEDLKKKDRAFGPKDKVIVQQVYNQLAADSKQAAEEAAAAEEAPADKDAAPAAEEATPAAEEAAPAGEEHKPEEAVDDHHDEAPASEEPSYDATGAGYDEPISQHEK